MEITSELIFKATGLDIVDNLHCDSLGLLVDSISNNMLSFISNIKYIKYLNENLSIKAVLCNLEIDKSNLVSRDIKKIVVDDPQWVFFSLVDYLGKNKKREKSYISNSAEIHPSSYISPYGVKIGINCLIEPNVTILSDVEIGNNVVVRSGAILGVDGFEHKKTSKGILSVAHDGFVFIGNNVEIGAGTHVAKGFSYRPTIVGDNTKIDALVHYAHGVQCGNNCLIAAKAMIAGNVTIGNDVWIGPLSAISNRVTIGNNAKITLGAVVIENVLEGKTVTGYFAVPHIQFLRYFKRSFT